MFDYVRRAMPYGNAQSLTPDETYALTAYLLYLNDLVKDEEFELSDKNFTSVKLPNAAAFYDDDRETTEKAFWGKEPCMSDCKADVKITNRAAVLDVTPDFEVRAEGRLIGARLVRRRLVGLRRHRVLGLGNVDAGGGRPRTGRVPLVRMRHLSPDQRTAGRRRTGDYRLSGRPVRRVDGCLQAAPPGERGDADDRSTPVG